MSGNYGTWTVVQLKRELANRGAKTSGRKKDLADRLECYVKNRNFQNASITLPVAQTMPAFPDTALFTSITGADLEFIPKVTDGHIRQYVLYRQVADRESNKDVSAMKKANKMVESAAVEALSYYRSGPQFFLTGIVNAEMRKHLSYNVKLVLNQSTGDIVNSACECPAGAGPTATCKHLVSSLQVLALFVSTGELVIDKSCTEKLQSFKKPAKEYNGRPVPAEKLGKGASDLDDPRPGKSKMCTEYNDPVISIMNCLTFSSLVSETLALLYTDLWILEHRTVA